MSTNHWPTRMQLIAVMEEYEFEANEDVFTSPPHPPALGGIFVYLMPSPRSMSAKPIYRNGWRETTWSVVSFLRIQGNDRATQSNVYWQIKSTLWLTRAVHLISNRAHKVNRKVHKADLKLNKNILAWILQLSRLSLGRHFVPTLRCEGGALWDFKFIPTSHGLANEGTIHLHKSARNNLFPVHSHWVQSSIISKAGYL